MCNDPKNIIDCTNIILSDFVLCRENISGVWNKCSNSGDFLIKVQLSLYCDAISWALFSLTMAVSSTIKIEDLYRRQYIIKILSSPHSFHLHLDKCKTLYLTSQIDRKYYQCTGSSSVRDSIHFVNCTARGRDIERIRIIPQPHSILFLRF